MVRFLLFFVPIVALSIYPFLDHPPIFVFKDGFVTLDFEGRHPEPLFMAVKTERDEFVLIDQPSKRHKIRIPVTENFEYRLKIGSVERSGRIALPSSEMDEATVLIFGDSRGNNEVLKRIVEMGKGSDFLMFLGDVAFSDFYDEDWRDFFESLSEFGGVVFTVRGNHEIPGLRYSEYLYPESYSFKIGKVNFLAVNHKFLASVDSEIEKLYSPGYFNVLVVHQPVVSCTEGTPAVDEELLDSLRKRGMSLVISSHDHNYQRVKTDGVLQLIFGGGGAPIYEVNEDCRGLERYYEGYSFALMKVKRDRILFEVFDLSGNLLDSFEVGM